MVEIRNFNAVEKLRKLVTWCDYQNDDFIAMFQTIEELEKCYDACHKHGVEFADNLSWDKDDPDYINSPQYLLAKDVNAILGVYHYNVGILTIPMLTQAKKDYLELLHKIENMPFCKAYETFKGCNLEANGMFDCNYKSISVTVERSIGGCELSPSVDIWDDDKVLSFRESFDELLYGHGQGCLVVDADGNLMTREVDMRDVLGLPGHNFDVGSLSLMDYIESHPEKEEELRSNGWLPLVYVSDEAFDSEYFDFVEKVRIAFFMMYEEFVTSSNDEIILDLDYYTGVRVKSLDEITDENWLAFMKAVEDNDLKWREYIRYRVM